MPPDSRAFGRSHGEPLRRTSLDATSSIQEHPQEVTGRMMISLGVQATLQPPGRAILAVPRWRRSVGGLEKGPYPSAHGRYEYWVRMERKW